MSSVLEGKFWYERLEKDMKKIRRSNPICKCGKEMKWYKSDTYCYYYRCECGKKKRRKYYHEYYLDRNNKIRLREIKAAN